MDVVKTGYMRVLEKKRQVCYRRIQKLTVFRILKT
jgi:hypothetical protein